MCTEKSLGRYCAVVVFYQADIFSGLTFFSGGGGGGGQGSAPGQGVTGIDWLLKTVQGKLMDFCRHR